MSSTFYCTHVISCGRDCCDLNDQAKGRLYDLLLNGMAPRPFRSFREFFLFQGFMMNWSNWRRRWTDRMKWPSTMHFAIVWKPGRFCCLHSRLRRSEIRPRRRRFWLSLMVKRQVLDYFGNFTSNNVWQKAAGKNKAKSDWNWEDGKAHMLKVMLELFQLKLERVWTMMNERAPFMRYAFLGELVWRCGPF